jgi:hypothetical protein
MTKLARTNAGKNQPFIDLVHYVRKGNACVQLPDRYVAALNGIDFQWAAGQNSRCQFEVRFANLKEFKKTHGIVFILGEDKKKPPKLASWNFYAKSMAFKVINKEANNYVSTLLRIKKLVSIGLVPLSHYKYEERAYGTGVKQP